MMYFVDSGIEMIQNDTLSDNPYNERLLEKTVEREDRTMLPDFRHRQLRKV